MTPVVSAKKLSKFDPRTFLSTVNGGRKIEAFSKKQTIFVQGDSSDAVFWIQEGRDDRHNAVAGQFFHEQVQEIGVH